MDALNSNVLEEHELNEFNSMRQKLIIPIYLKSNLLKEKIWIKKIVILFSFEFVHRIILYFLFRDYLRRILILAL